LTFGCVEWVDLDPELLEEVRVHVDSLPHRGKRVVRIFPLLKLRLVRDLLRTCCVRLLLTFGFHGTKSVLRY
jgi:hypothetical protein